VVCRDAGGRARLLILDELSLGPEPVTLDALADGLRRVHAEGTTVFVVEQAVVTAFALATTGYVLENGPHVKKAYLGL
jgi:branched-chain amino acid transport system ATP-binding protein